MSYRNERDRSAPAEPAPSVERCMEEVAGALESSQEAVAALQEGDRAIGRGEPGDLLVQLNNATDALRAALIHADRAARIARRYDD